MSSHKSKHKSKHKEVKATGFNKLYQPSDELAAVLHSDKPVSRKQVTSKLWEYIKGHELQDPQNKRNIVPNKKMAKVFGKKTFNMFAMAKMIGKHLTDV